MCVCAYVCDVQLIVMMEMFIFSLMFRASFAASSFKTRKMDMDDVELVSTRSSTQHLRKENGSSAASSAGGGGAGGDGGGGIFRPVTDFSVRWLLEIMQCNVFHANLAAGKEKEKDPPSNQSANGNGLLSNNGEISPRSKSTSIAWPSAAAPASSPLSRK